MRSGVRVGPHEKIKSAFNLLKIHSNDLTNTSTRAKKYNGKKKYLLIFLSFEYSIALHSPWLPIIFQNDNNIISKSHTSFF